MTLYPHRLWHWAIGPVTRQGQALAAVTYAAMPGWWEKHEAALKRSVREFAPAVIEAVRAGMVGNWKQEAGK